ncbi:hypothetical protein F4703DRAFT_1937642 [Phycomyces blakesleeanus]
MAKNDDQIYIHYGRPNIKDQNSNLGYSVFMIRLHNEKFVFLPVRQSKPAIMDPISVQCYSVLAVKGNEQEHGLHIGIYAFTVYANDSESKPYPE